jgi:hypothetical protein
MTTKRELKNRLAYKNDRELLLADIAFENVLDWLNGSEATKASRKRVRGLIEDLCVIASPATLEALHHKRLPEELAQRLQRTNEFLANYPTTPSIGWNPRGHLEFGQDFEGRRLELEGGVVYSLISIAELGLVDRIRKCICGVWFQARRQNQRSCSPTCRHKVYAETPAAKTRRREYMRAYYRLKTSGKVK